MAGSDTSQGASPAPSGNDTSGGSASTTPTVPAVSSRSINLWAFLSIAVVMAAIVAIVWKVLDASDPDSSVAVLGVIIPVFATIGAAVFGIPVAYQRGSEAGAQQATSTKQQEIAAASDSAAAHAKDDARKQMEPVVQQLRSSTDALLNRVRASTFSPRGTNFHLAMAPERFALNPEDLSDDEVIPNSALTDVEKQVAQLESMLRTLGD